MILASLSPWVAAAVTVLSSGVVCVTDWFAVIELTSRALKLASGAVSGAAEVLARMVTPLKVPAPVSLGRIEPLVTPDDVHDTTPLPRASLIDRGEGAMPPRPSAWLPVLVKIG